MKLDLRLDPTRAAATGPLKPRNALLPPQTASGDRASAFSGPQRAVVAGAVPVLRTVVQQRVRKALPSAPVGDAPGPAVLVSNRWFVADLPSDGLVVIPAGTTLEGDCRAHSIYVGGTVRGQLCAFRGMLIVAEGGQVFGGVEAHGPMVVAGRVKATGGALAVLARTTLSLACSARVSGTVEFSEVTVYDGAHVEGQMRQR